jgi:hypothetical protein
MANQGFMTALRAELDKMENPPAEGE